MARIARLRSGGLLAEADVSAVGEQQLGLELLRNVERQQPGGYADFSDVMYQRTATKEVDFSGPRFGALGFESKYVDSRWRHAAVTVRSAFGAGILATRATLDTAGDVWAVPAPFVAWMLND